MLTVASFFSGVGLLDLGLEWAGWRTVSQSEIDPYASRVLGLRFPGIPNLGDITSVNHVPDATLWAGGFPCQPVSIAGKGRAQDDHRWLWPAWARLVREFRPPIILLENVSNLLAVNDGRAFGEVLGDLASLGYDAEWDCIPAAAVGAPHLRDRVWVIGTRAEQRRPVADPDDRGPRDPVRAGRDAARDGGPDVADADGGRLDPGSGRQGHGRLSIVDQDGHPRLPGAGSDPDRAGLGELVREQPPVGSRRDADGLRAHRERITWWRAEPDVGRVAHGVPSRVDRLRCLGNGVVPQVAEFLGWRIRGWLGE